MGRRPARRGEALASRDHRPDDLVPRDERKLRLVELAVDDVQIGAAYPAGRDADQDLARQRGAGSATSAGSSGRPGARSTIARTLRGYVLLPGHHGHMASKFGAAVGVRIARLLYRRWEALAPAERERLETLAGNVKERALEVRGQGR